MIAKVTIICLLVAAAHGIAVSVVSGVSGGLGHGLLGGTSLLGEHSVVIAKPSIAHVEDSYAVPHYEYNYAVHDAHTGDNKQQSETRVGDSVKGEYSLAEPDGTIRVVKYTSDPHNGFNAVVSRVGHAAHPQIVHAVATHEIGLGLH